MPQHGRDHQQREGHIGTGRSRSTPDKADEETEMFAAGRQRWMPKENVYGANRGRRRITGTPASLRDRSREPVAAGAEVAPTAKAVRDQARRHSREGSLMRISSRTAGKAGRPRKAGKSRSK
jgi:hypothetical protein